MIHWVLSTLWDSAFAQFGIAGLVLIGAIAAFVWLGNLPGVRHASIAVASVCVIFLFLGPKLYFEGVSHERAKWEAAEKAAAERGTEARTEAEREVAAEPDPPPEPEPPATAGGGRGAPAVVPPRRMRHDKYERDDR